MAADEVIKSPVKNSDLDATMNDDDGDGTRTNHEEPAAAASALRNRKQPCVRECLVQQATCHPHCKKSGRGAPAALEHQDKRYLDMYY